MARKKELMVNKKMLAVGGGVLLVIVLLLLGAYGKNIRTATNPGTDCLTQAMHDQKVTELANLQKQLDVLTAGAFPPQKGNKTPDGPINQLKNQIVAESQKIKLPAGVDILRVVSGIDYALTEQTILDSCAQYPKQCPYNNSQYREIQANIDEDNNEVGPMLNAINADKDAKKLQDMIKNLQTLLIKKSDILTKIANDTNDVSKPICPPTTTPTTTTSPKQTPNPIKVPTPTLIKPTPNIKY